MTAFLLALTALGVCLAGASLARGGWTRLWADAGGVAMELLTGFVTAAGGTQTALTMSTGDSLTVKSSPMDRMIRLLSAWVDSQATGSLRIRSPRLHDNVQGIRLAHVASEVDPLLPIGLAQRLYTQDTLTVDLSGSAVALDIDTAALLLYYDDLPGVAAHLIGIDELLRRGVHELPVENTLALGTAGGWSGGEAINAEFDPFKANTEYALVGYQANVEAAAVAWRGADTGNLRVGGPGNETDKHLTADWFIRLTRAFGIPLIPVFNSANKAAITIDGAQDENGTDPLVNSIFVELAPGGGR